MYVMKLMRMLAVLIVHLAGVTVVFACSTEPASTPSDTPLPEPSPTPKPPSPALTPVSTPTPKPAPKPAEPEDESVAAESLVMLEDPLDEPEF
jgi:outer membrane biosynthesis protein TonB